MSRIELTRHAERDLIDIHLFGVERFGPMQAERYAEALGEKIAMVAENPGFGADYGFVGDGLRRHECASHAIHCRRTTEGILVPRVLHARMDPGRHLGN